MAERISSTRDRINGVFDRTGDSPLVSVVITTYDRPSYLRKAVQSVLKQTYESLELVVVDDHSEEPAREALDGVDLSALTDFKYVRHEENRGANAARNTGIKAVSGEYVAFLDDDDQWVPEKIERQIEAFNQAAEGVGVVYCGTETIESVSRGEEIPPPVEGDMTKTLLCRNVVGSMSVVMVRTRIAREVPLDEEFPAWADLEWYIRLSQRTKFERLPKPLTVYEYTSHGRLSDDLDKKLKGYDRFVDQFDPIAAEYGYLFRRKMHGWAAFRIGKSALFTGDYGCARQFFVAAITSYPFEPNFGKYFVASVGGRFTHEIARELKRITA